MGRAAHRVGLAEDGPWRSSCSREAAEADGLLVTALTRWWRKVWTEWCARHDSAREDGDFMDGQSGGNAEDSAEGNGHTGNKRRRED